MKDWKLISFGQSDRENNELIHQSGPSLWKCILNQIDETVGTGIQVKYFRWFKKHQTRPITFISLTFVIFSLG